MSFDVYKCSAMFTGKDFFEEASLVVKDSIIAYAGPTKQLPAEFQEKKVDSEHCFIMPGLIDSHVHLFLDPEEDSYHSESSDLATVATLTAEAINHSRELISAGITSIRDLGAPYNLNTVMKELIEQEVCSGPKITSAGSVIAVTAGHGSNISITCDGEEQMKKGVRSLVAEGADLIKLMVTGGINASGMEPGAPVFTREEVEAAVDVAGKLGRRVAVHATGTTGIGYCVDAGVNSIEHGVYLTGDLIEKMVKKGIFLVPTLSAPYHASIEGLKNNPDSEDHKKSAGVIERHKKSFLDAFNAGVPIACGSDAGTPYNRFCNAAFEVVLMADYGIGSFGALRAATSNAAELLGISTERGSLEAGKQADFLILEGNPLEDIRNLIGKKHVYMNGEELYV